MVIDLSRPRRSSAEYPSIHEGSPCRDGWPWIQDRLPPPAHRKVITRTMLVALPCTISVDVGRAIVRMSTAVMRNLHAIAVILGLFSAPRLPSPVTSMARSTAM